MSSTSTDLTIRRILYATNFTPSSLGALPYAVSLAEHCGAHLTLLHVVRDTPGEPVPSKESRLEECRSQLRALVSGKEQMVDEPDLVVGFGTPGTRILAVAAEQSSDLIVMGLREAADQFTGRRWSTASDITGKANCGVLTVRAPQF
jgi:nucleotide-binding universal stress UspA family protein